MTRLEKQQIPTRDKKHTFARTGALILLCVGIILFLLFRIFSFSYPNIILISIDSVRPDHLGCYGYARNTSPHIDAFAKNSTVYRNCFSAGSWTIPSNFSMLTSLYLPQHNMGSWDAKLDKATPTLFSEFRRHHYAIGIFGNTGFLIKSLWENFGQLVDVYMNKQTESEVTDEALRWMSRQRAPFLTWIYYPGAHRPYTPPPPHNTLFPYQPGMTLPIQKTDADHKGGWDYIPEVMASDHITDVNYYIAQYDGEIHYIDEEIGRLLNELKKTGLYDRSIIVLMSDHGESLGEHHLYFNHTWTLFNEVIKTPLILKLPGQTKGKTYHENVSLIDVFPTLLRETRVGKPRLLHLEGTEIGNAPPKSRGLFAYKSHSTAFLYHDWKLIEYPERSSEENAYIKFFFPGYPAERYQLFNLKNDPSELSDLKISRPNEFDELYREYCRQKPLATQPPHAQTPLTISEEDKEILHSLGYAQ